MTTATDREIVMDRVVDAPRDVVWEAWTQVEHIERWWGGDGSTTTTQEFDLRPGGVWRFIMHGPGGRDFEIRVVFREVARPDHLTYVHDEVPGVVPEFLTTVTFEEVDGKTRVTMRSSFASKEERDRVWEEGAKEGGVQMLARMAEYARQMPA